MTRRMRGALLPRCAGDYGFAIAMAGRVRPTSMIGRMHRIAIAAALALLIPAASAAQHFPSDEDLTALIRSRVEEERTVGIVLGILEADGTSRIVSFGDAGPNARTLGARSVFEIGSITKLFTATLLADMVLQGEVRLSDPVSAYLPDRVDLPSQAGRRITLLDLATHYSALPRVPSNLLPEDAANPYADYSVERMYEFLSTFTPLREIGSEYEYSNIGVGLLGHVLAQVGGGSYEDVVRTRILDPLGMDRTGIRLEGEMADWMAEGHDTQGDVVPLWDFGALAGAGALRSDVGDMLAFLEANTGRAESPLERAMRVSHEIRRDVSEDASVGLNWHTRHVGGERIVWHNGSTAGFRTFIGFDPARGLGVVVLTNSRHGADDIGFHLINPAVPLAAGPGG